MQFRRAFAALQAIGEWLKAGKNVRGCPEEPQARRSSGLLYRAYAALHRACGRLNALWARVRIVRSRGPLPPASFTMVMGTGAFAVCTLHMGAIWPWLIWPAWLLNWLNFGLLLLLFWLALTSWPGNLARLREDLASPHRAALLAALGISFLVLSCQAFEFGLGQTLAVWLWLLGLLLTLAINFATFLRFFLRRQLSLDSFTPVFYIPVGGLAVIPVAGSRVLALAQGRLFDLALMVNVMSAGGAILLYLGLFSLMLQRHLLTEPLPARLAPTLWIHMAPIGWGGVGLLGLAQVCLSGEAWQAARFMAALMWGGACWWLVMASLMTLGACLRRQLGFSLAAWAFIFPLGAMTTLSGRLGQSFALAFPPLWLLMAALWLICAVGTLRFLSRLLAAVQAGRG